MTSENVWDVIPLVILEVKSGEFVLGLRGHAYYEKIKGISIFGIRRLY